MWSKSNVQVGDEMWAMDVRNGEVRYGVVTSTDTKGCTVAFDGDKQTTFVAWANVENAWR